MLGAVAAGRYPDLLAAMPAMSRIGDSYPPALGAMRGFHNKRYAAFLSLQAAARAIR
jgi:D-ribulokinase